MKEEVQEFARQLTEPIHGGQPTKLFRVAVATWIAFAVALSIKVLVSPVHHSSYPAFESGCRLWWAELNMYQGTWNEFRYGPAFAVAFSPLLNLPIALGQLVWTWLNLAAFVWSLRTLVREILPAHWTPNLEGAFMLVVLATSYRGMWAVQSNTLLFALVVAGMHAILHNRFGWAALWLALPVHVKIWPLAAALLLIACWPRKLAARFLCALTAVAALPLLTKWPTVVLERYYEWYLALTGPMQTRHDYRDLWTVWEFIVEPVDARAYLALQLATALLALALCLWQKRRGATVPLLLTLVLAMWTTWQLAAGPGSERNTFGLVAPVSAWALIASWSRRRGRTLVSAAVVLMFIASVGQIERALTPSIPVVLAAHPIGVVLLALWVSIYTLGWRSAETPTATPASDGLTRRHSAFAGTPVTERKVA